VVDRVLEHPWERTVVFGSDEQQALCGRDFGLQAADRIGGTAIVVLVVERQIADLYLGKQEVGWRQPADGGRQAAVVRIAPQAADDNGDLVLAHGDLQ